jgi:F-type H+-transporting ATPase subunit b
MTTMIRALTLTVALTATPALAASGPFFSLSNTNFVVLIAFLLFVGVLIYYKIPGLLMGLLDKRAVQIRAELDEARAVREEAQQLLASFERKSRDVVEQAERIVKHAKEEAGNVAEEAKVALAKSLERRLKAADEQIANAEAAAVKEVRDSAVQIAVAAAGDVIAKSMTTADANSRIDAAIKVVEDKLH